MRCSTYARLAAVCFSLASLSAVQGAVVTHGSFVGNNVRYFNVQEDSGTDLAPLFGAPVIAGDTLDFSPTSFNSSSTGPSGVDITDGTLTFFLESLNGTFLDQVNLFEQGDVRLLGFGNAGTFAAVFADVYINILEVDGVSINPINLVGSLTFSPSAGDFNLADDAGGGPLYQSTWSGSLSFDLTQALLDREIDFDCGVTLISVNLDNTLVTLSQAGTSSFIAKKDVQVFTTTGTCVPEASSFMMLSVVATGFVLITQRRLRTMSV